MATLLSKNKFTQNWGSSTTWLQFLMIVLLLLGIFFRFVNLDRKVYWHDETYTSIWISGYRPQEIIDQVFNGQVISSKDLQKYQYPNPETSLIDTLRNVATEDPQHPPLYYLITRLWVQGFGNSVAVTRSVSAVISLLALPCIYWLCLELFESPLVGWIAIALISVSPFHILYAQEAREYSLWMMTILLSSAALLQAMRLKTKLSWGIYAVTLALGLYTYLFSILIAIGQGIYVVITQRFRFNKTIAAYLLASIAGFLTFIPWLNNLHEVNAAGWTAQKMALSTLVKIWAANLSRIFFDLNLDANDSLIYTIPPILILLILVGYSLYFLPRKTPERVWLFILTLVGVTAIALILPDLILGGRRSSVSRYLIPCYLGIQLAVAYLLATHIFSARSLQRKFWQVIMAVLISAGVVSCAVSSQADTWWIKKNSHNNPQAARIINQATQPLLVSSNYRFNLGEILSLSHLLTPKVRLQLVNESNIPKIPDGFSDVFIFNPSTSRRWQLEKAENSKLEEVSPSKLRLWKLKK